MAVKKHVRVVGTAVVLAGLLAGCSLFEDEEKLEGERIRIRDAGVAQTFGGTAEPIPAQIQNSAWTQTNGQSSHASGHLAASSSLSVAWTVDAGAGAEGGITSAPIVLDGRVFTLDTASQATAFDAGSGARIWRADLAPEGEDGEDGFGGGLAAEGNTILATTGFGEVLALSAASGDILWRYKAGAPFRASPAVSNGRVIAVTRDNRAVALDVASGNLLWRIDGITAEAGLLGGASPAISGPLAVLPFASGEVIGAEVTTGRTVWSAVLGGARRGLARASISDVTGDPVIAGRAVVAANQSGRVVAIDGQTGRRGWTRSIGSTGPIWAAGQSLYMTGDDASLIRLSLQTGQTIWATELPAFEDEEDREDPIAYSGPVLAGGQVLVTDTLGQLLAFDPVTGAQRSTIDLADSATSGVAVASGTVYVLSDDATLHALR